MQPTPTFPSFNFTLAPIINLSNLKDQIQTLKSIPCDYAHDKPTPSKQFSLKCNELLGLAKGHETYGNPATAKEITDGLIEIALEFESANQTESAKEIYRLIIAHQFQIPAVEVLLNHLGIFMDDSVTDVSPDILSILRNFADQPGCKVFSYYYAQLLLKIDPVNNDFEAAGCYMKSAKEGHKKSEEAYQLLMSSIVPDPVQHFVITVNTHQGKKDDIRTLKAAAKQGNVSCMLRVAKQLTSTKYYLMAANAGDVEAQFWIMANKVNPKEKDLFVKLFFENKRELNETEFLSAERNLGKAIKAGYGFAALKLTCVYLHNFKFQGVTIRKAEECFKLAHHVPGAQIVVQENLLLAANSGNKDAQLWLMRIENEKQQ